MRRQSRLTRGPCCVLFVLFFLLPELVDTSPAGAQVSFGDETSSLGRTIHVHPTGSATANAAALTAALGSAMITGRVTPAAEPVLIELGPGTYDFGMPAGSAITMPDHVHLRGAGIDATVLKCDCSEVLRALNTTNRFAEFTVENVGSGVGTFATMFLSNDANIDISQVKSVAANGILAATGSTVRIVNSILMSSLDDAIQVSIDSTVTLEHSHVDGPDSSNDGVVFISNQPSATSIFYSFIGPGGVTTSPPAGGTQVCVATRSATAFAATGCPAPAP